MKNLFKYFLYSLIFLIVSCADEGPFEVGQFDIQTEVDQVTATTAIVKVKVPESKKQLLKEINNLLLNGEYSWDNDYHNDMYSVSATEKHFLLTNLKPSTTYEVSITGNTKESDHYNWITINTTQKFTTSQAGDYNALNLMASSEIIRKIGNVVWVKISLPEKLDFSNQNEKRSLLFSKSQDMADPSVTDVQRGWEDGGEYFYAILEGVEDGMEYYLKLTGDFTYTFPEFGLQEIIELTGLKEIGFERPLAITGESIGDGLSANLLMTKRYSESDNHVSAWIDFGLSQEMSFTESEYVISWSQTKEFDANSPSITVNGSLESKSVVCDNLELGKSYYFKIDGNLGFTFDNGETYTGQASLITSAPLEITEKGASLFACDLLLTTPTTTSIKITLPEKVQFYSDKYSIHWKNADNSVSQWDSKEIEGSFWGINEVTVTLPALTPNQKGYQLYIDGNFKFEALGSNTISTILYASAPLMIKGKEAAPFTCKLVLATPSVTNIAIQLPQGTTFGDGDHTIYWKNADNSVIDWESQVIKDYISGQNELNVALPSLAPNQNGYQLYIEGNFRFEAVNNETINTRLYSEKNLQITNDALMAATCSLEFYYGREAIVNFQLPNDLTFINSGVVIASTSEDFSGVTTESRYTDYNSSDIRLKLGNLDPASTYYFRLKGDFSKNLGNGQSVNLDNETISVKGSIKLSDSQKTFIPGACELLTTGNNFTVVRLSVSDKYSFGNGGSISIYYSESENFNITNDLNVSRNDAGIRDNLDVLGNFPDLEVGKRYYFKTKGDVTYDNTFLFKDVILSFSGSILRPPLNSRKAGMGYIFDHKDFSAYQLFMPDNIDFEYPEINLSYTTDGGTPLRVSSNTMVFLSLPAGEYNFSVNGWAKYKWVSTPISIGDINMEVEGPVYMEPDNKYLIEVSQFKDGSKECIALKCDSEIVRFLDNAPSAYLQGPNANGEYLDPKSRSGSLQTFTIPENVKLVTGQEYTVTYNTTIEFFDQARYGDATYSLNASYSFVYNGTDTATGTRSTLKSRRLTKLKSASISSLPKNKSPRKTTRRNKTAVKKTTAKR